MSQVIWIASYPKSGNTWMRALLSNYLDPQDEPVEINKFHRVPESVSLSLFEQALGVLGGNLTRAERSLFQPSVYCALVKGSPEPLHFLKIHDANQLLPDGAPMFPTGCTRGAVYIIRNPLDVVTSFRHFFAVDLEAAIASMNDSSFSLTMGFEQRYRQFRHYLGSWSGHVLSWIDTPQFPVHMVRYEDLLAKPEETFLQVVRFVGLEVDAERVRRAVEFSSFDQLKKQEKERTFRQNPHSSQPFFRQGRANTWREELTPEQIERLVDAHREVMQRLGYL